jgi:hypothetical protein
MPLNQVDTATLYVFIYTIFDVLTTILVYINAVIKSINQLYGLYRLYSMNPVIHGSRPVAWPRRSLGAGGFPAPSLLTSRSSLLAPSPVPNPLARELVNRLTSSIPFSHHPSNRRELFRRVHVESFERVRERDGVDVSP